MRCYAVLGDLTSYQPLCRETIEELGKNSDPKTRNGAIRTASVMPGALSDYTNVLQIAKKPMDGKSVADYQFHTYGR